MKKAFVIILLSILIFPQTIYACPHFDEDGNMYFMYYDMDDYNTTIIFYPRDGYNQEYKYHTEMTTGEYIDTKPREAILYEENFEVPLYMIRDIFDFDSPFEEKEEQPIIQYENQVLIKGDFFDLKIELENPKSVILPSDLKSISTASLLINHKILNEDSNYEKYKFLSEILDELNVKGSMAHSFQQGQLIIDTNWQEEEIFYDKVVGEMVVSKQTEYENPRVINISSLTSEQLTIKEVSSELEEGKVIYSPQEKGYYMVVNSANEIEEQSFENKKENIVYDNDDSLFKTSLVISGGILLFGTLIYFTTKKD